MRRTQLWLLAFLLLTACDRHPTTTFSDTRMHIAYKVIVGHPLSSKQANKIQRIIDQTFDEINATFNEWNPDSEVGIFNAASAGVLPLSCELRSFLDATEEIVHATQGRFDPTVEPLVKLWRDHKPSPEEIGSVQNAVGWKHIRYDDTHIIKEHDKTRLTFGGIAKGYLVDLLTDNLEKAGFHNLYIEWGGEIATRGQHPEGRPWRVLLTRFGTPESAVDTLDLRDCSLATSGNYHQKWTYDGKTFTHIIDPSTREPLLVSAQRPVSVTVMAKSCMLADALATAAMIFDDISQARDFALEMQKIYPETQFWLFAEDPL